MNIRKLSGAIARDPRIGICDHPNCDEKLPGRRRTFCSDSCGELFFMENNWSGIRFIVFLKNKGECQKCDRNLIFNKSGQLISFIKLDHFATLITANDKFYNKYLNGKIYTHQDTDLINANTRWCTGGCIQNLNVEIDHIQAIYKGGDPLDINNMQTLCKKCHLIKTKSDRRGFEPTNINDYFKEEI